MRFVVRSLPLITMLLLLPSTAGAAEIGPTQPAHESPGIPFLEIGRWILIVLAFAAIAGALIVKLRVARSLRSEARDQSSAS